LSDVFVEIALPARFAPCPPAAVSLIFSLVNGFRRLLLYQGEAVNKSSGESDSLSGDLRR
jgi:hypothetical protein